jgi:prolyl-tRNA editing enzyme YbaK/EbsC (Cys-tRNA(Pro) deacylase)
MEISKSAVGRVTTALRTAGIEARVVELSESTRTADEAAKAIECSVGQIAKSLIFRSESGESILVVASGSNRVDERKVAKLIGEAVQRASPEFVREMTGYAIGGIPPTAHSRPPRAVLIDSDLEQYDEIWAAAGTPHAVVRLTPTLLLQLSNGRMVDVKR